MNENIDLTKILKDCPEGTEFWSDNYGKVRFKCINTSLELPVTVRRTDGYNAYYTEEGWYSSDFPASCLLWPSKDCRDWSKFTAPWYKKGKFDPKTLKPFDKVLIKSDDDITWVANLFSHAIKFHDKVTGNDYLESVTAYCISSYCIPYNEETKHLVGTMEEAPEYYRYWED